MLRWQCRSTWSAIRKPRSLKTPAIMCWLWSRTALASRSHPESRKSTTRRSGCRSSGCHAVPGRLRHTSTRCRHSPLLRGRCNGDRETPTPERSAARKPTALHGPTSSFARAGSPYRGDGRKRAGNPYPHQITMYGPDVADTATASSVRRTQ